MKKSAKSVHKSVQSTPVASGTTVSSRALVWAPGLLIAVAGLLVYANTFDVPFVLDDKRWIAENLAIRQVWPPTQELLGNTRPWACYSLALNYYVHGREVWGYHAVNLAIHITAGWLLYGIALSTLRRLGEPLARNARWLALAIALIWLVHPLQTQAVTYIIQRMESLMGMALLATLYFFIRGTQSSYPWRWYLGSLTACAFGLGCKEVMVSAPLVVLWYDRAFVATSWRELLGKRKYYYAGLAACWGLLAGIIANSRYSFEANGAMVVEDLTPWTYLLSQSAVIVRYLTLAVWPSGQCFDYVWPISHTITAVLPQAIIVVALLAATVWSIVRAPRWSFLGGWFFLILAPTSSFLPIRDLAVEHRMYLPLAAIVGGIVVASYLLSIRLGLATSRRSWACASVAGAVVIALGVAAYARNGVYESERSLWGDTVTKAPHNSRAWENLGCAFTEARQFAPFRECFERALALSPNEGRLRANYGACLFDCGQTAAAREQLELALRLDPRDQLALTNMGQYLLCIERYDEATQFFERGLAGAPGDRECRTNYAAALVRAGRFEEAAQQCAQVLRAEPGHAEARTNLANALVGQGRHADALRECEAALQAEPDNANAHATCARLLTDTRPREARQHLERALELEPTSPEINLGMGIFVVRDDPRAAIEFFDRALKARPQFADAHFNLANAWVACGRPEMAISHLQSATSLRPDWPEAQQNLAVLLRWAEESRPAQTP